MASALRTWPITIEVLTADEIWDAALLKAKYNIAYAYAFAAALAQKHRCPLVTGDPGFRRLPDLQIEWLGANAQITQGGFSAPRYRHQMLRKGVALVEADAALSPKCMI